MPRHHDILFWRQNYYFWFGLFQCNCLILTPNYTTFYMESKKNNLPAKRVLYCIVFSIYCIVVYIIALYISSTFVSLPDHSFPRKPLPQQKLNHPQMCFSVFEGLSSKRYHCLLSFLTRFGFLSTAVGSFIVLYWRFVDEEGLYLKRIFYGLDMES